MTWRHIRDLIIGSPLPSEGLSKARLDNARALAALSPDALTSIAYANQEIFPGLAAEVGPDVPAVPLGQGEGYY